MRFGSIPSRIKRLLPNKRISLFLHIGMPKTGTTAIQNLMDNNRDLLSRKYGILYPACGIPSFQHAAFVKSIVAPRYNFAKFNKAIESFDPVEYVNRIVDQCRQQKCGRVLLSSEFFWAAPAMQSDLPYHAVNEENLGYIDDFVSQCRTLFDVFDKTCIVVYARRQDYWIDSFFGQQIKDGFKIPSQEELLRKKVYLLFKENLNIWANYFGRDNVIVKIYDDAIQDVTEDFCHEIGVDRTILGTPGITADTINTRLSPIALKVMHDAIAIQLEPELMALLKDVLRKTSFALVDTNKRYGVFPWGRDFYNSILDTYYENNCEAAEMYPAINRIVSRESDLVLPDEMHVDDSVEYKTEQLLESLLKKIRKSG